MVNRLFYLLLMVWVPFMGTLEAQHTNNLQLTGIQQREKGLLQACQQSFAQAKSLAAKNDQWDGFVENAIRESEAFAWAMNPKRANAILTEAEEKINSKFGPDAPLTWRLKTFRLEQQRWDGKGDRFLKAGVAALEYWKNKQPNALLDLALAHLYVGKIRSEMGDFGGARENLEASVLTLAKHRNTHGWELQDAYAFLVNVNMFMGELGPMNQYLAKAEALAQQMNPAPHFRTANLLRLKATLPALQQQFAEATTMYNRALAELAGYPEINELRATLYSNLSLMYGKTGKFDQSVEAAQQALRLYENNLGKRHYRSVKVYSNLGIAYESLEDYKKAYAAARKAILCLAPDWEPKADYDLPPIETFNYTLLFISKITEAGAYLEELYEDDKSKIDYIKEAYNHYNWALDAIDLMRRDLASADAEYSFQIYKHLPQCYEFALHAAWLLYQDAKDEKYLQEAFSCMEKRKSSLLYASLQGREALHFGGIPTEVLQKEQHLKLRYSNARRNLLEAHVTGDALLRLRQIQSEADVDYKAFLRTLEKDYPDYYEIQYARTAPAIKSIQAYLAKTETTLLEFHINSVDENALYVLRLTGSEKGLVRTILDEKEKETIAYLLDKAHDPQQTIAMGNDEQYFKQFLGASRKVYEALLDSVLQPTDKNLLIVPADELYYIPFEMLLEKPAPPSRGVNYSIQPWLIQDRGVRYAFSTALLLHEQHRPSASKSFAGFAPMFSQNVGLPGQRALSRLRFANAEVKAINAILGGQLFLDEQANKETLRAAAKDFNIMHLASHAVTEKEDPLHSYIALGDKERLFAYELYDWQINSDLAVLSACNTGVGELASGEGVMSMARAFRYAGCPNLLVSLWQVDDESTRILMERFYHHLNEGKAKHEALRMAKLDYLAAKHKTHPYFWAPFILLSGDAPEPTPYSNWWWWAAAALGVVGIGYWLQSKRSPAPAAQELGNFKNTDPF